MTEAPETSSTARVPSRGRIMTIVRRLALGIVCLLLVAVLAVAAGLVWLRTEAAEHFLKEQLVAGLRKAGITATLDELRGPLPGELSLRGLVLADADGEWLKLGEAKVRVDWLELAHWRFVVREISLGRADVLRLPVFPESPEAQPSEKKADPLDTTRLLARLPAVRVDDLRIGRLSVAPEVLGLPAGGRLELSAEGKLSAAPDGIPLAALKLIRARGPASGDTLEIAAGPAAPDNQLLDLKVKLHEAAGGLIGALAGLPDAISLTLEGAAPPRDWKGAFTLDAGGLVQAEGRLGYAVMAGGGGLLTFDAGVQPRSAAPREVRMALGDRTALEFALRLLPGALQVPALRAVAPAWSLKAEHIDVSGGSPRRSPNIAGTLQGEITDPAALGGLPFASAGFDMRLSGRLDKPAADLRARVEALSLAEKPADAPYPNVSTALRAEMTGQESLSLRGEITVEHALGIRDNMVRMDLEADASAKGRGYELRHFQAKSDLLRATALGEWNPDLPFPHVDAQAELTLPRLADLCALFGISGIDAGTFALAAKLGPAGLPGAAKIEAADGRVRLAGFADARLSGMRWGGTFAPFADLVGDSARLRAELSGSAPYGEKSGNQETAAAPVLDISKIQLETAGLTGGGDIRLDMAGNGSFAGKLELVLRDLGLLPGAAEAKLGGALRAILSADGSFAKPGLSLTVDSASLRVAGETLTAPRLQMTARADVSGELCADGRAELSARTRAGDTRLSTQAKWRGDTLSIADFSGMLAGVDLKGDGTAKFPAGKPPQITARLAAAVRDWAGLAALAGPVSAKEATFTIALSPDVAGRQNAEGSVTLRDFVSGDTQVSSLTAQARGSNLFVSPEGSLEAELGPGAAGVRWDKGRLSARYGKDGGVFSASTAGELAVDVAAWQKEKTLGIDKLNIRMGKQFGVDLDAPVRVTGIGGPSTVVPETKLRLMPSGEVTFGGRFGSAMDLSLALHQLSLKSLGALAGVKLPEGMLGADIQIRGTLARLAAQFSLVADDIREPGSSAAPIRLALTGDLPAGGRTLTAKLDSAGLGEKGLSGTVRVPVRQGAGGPSLDMAAPLSGQIHWEGPLAPLWTFAPLPDCRLEGEGSLDAAIAGTLAAPRPSGTLRLNNVQVFDLRSGVALRAIMAEAVVSPSGQLTLKMDGGDGRGGTLALETSLEMMREGMPLQAKLTLDKLRPLRRADVRVSLSGNITAKGPALTPMVTGEVTVDSGELRLDRLSGSSFTTLEVENMEAPAAQTTESARRPRTGMLNLRILIPKKFYVRGHGVESEWEGDLRIRGAFNNPSIRGRIASVRGVMDLLGKTFTLSRGVISLRGERPPRPALDIEVRRELPGMTARALITGTTSKTKLTLTSQPPMAEDEVLARMLFGRSASELSHVEALHLAAAAAALAGGGDVLGVMGTTRDALGVDVLRVGGSRFSSNRSQSNGNPLAGPSAQGDDDDDSSPTTIEMGKYLNDNVYVGVQQGLGENSTEVFMDVELSPRVNFEARTSSDSSSVGLNWNWDY